MDAAISGRWTHGQLLACPGRGSADDRHVFACLLAIAAVEAPVPMSVALGLSRADLADLVATYFPAALPHLPAELPDGDAVSALEEEDLRDLLLRHRGGEGREAVWLAQMVARRSLRPNHLWEDLGLFARSELSGLMARHFPGLFARNGGMRWKKFFYRQLCEAEGLSICKSPVCSQCSDFSDCFAPATGDPV